MLLVKCILCNLNSGHGDSAVWVKGNLSAAVPLITWNNHTGVVTMTYHPTIRKYILVVSTADHYPSMTQEFDTYFLESDSITGYVVVGGGDQADRKPICKRSRIT